MLVWTRLFGPLIFLPNFFWSQNFLLTKLFFMTIIYQDQKYVWMKNILDQSLFRSKDFDNFFGPTYFWSYLSLKSFQAEHFRLKSCFFQFLGGGDPFQLRSWSEGEAIWQVPEDPYHTEFVSQHVEHFKQKKTRLESKVFSLEKLCLSLFSLVLSP